MFTHSFFVFSKKNPDLEALIFNYFIQFIMNNVPILKNKHVNQKQYYKYPYNIRS